MIEVECTCLRETVVLPTPNMMDVTVIDCLLKLHVSKRFFFFVLLEVKFGCGHGSSTKIKTADIERIMCATVVTFKKTHTVGGSQISFGRYMHVPVIEINLHNNQIYQEQRLV